MGERCDENRRIKNHLQLGQSVMASGGYASPEEESTMCVPCSNITDGEPVCDKCFAAFVRTADMPREMYKRYGRFQCARMVPRCPSCMKPGTTSTTWQVPICTKCWQYVHFDIDPDQFMLRSMAVMMSTQPRLGSDALIRDLPDQLLRMICTLSATHDLGPTGAWGMCCMVT